MSDQPTDPLLALTVEIVTAHIGSNHLPTAEVPALIASVHAALEGLTSPAVAPALTASAEYPPATKVRKSLADPNHIISMIDGKPYKMLRRHLRTNGLTPDEYRARYGLKADYPMIAPAYSEKRRAVAKAIGLGRKPRVAEQTPAVESKRRGRKPGGLSAAIASAKRHLDG